MRIKLLACLLFWLWMAGWYSRVSLCLCLCYQGARCAARDVIWGELSLFCQIPKKWCSMSKTLNKVFELVASWIVDRVASWTVFSGFLKQWRLVNEKNMPSVIKMRNYVNGIQCQTHEWTYIRHISLLENTLFSKNYLVQSYKARVATAVDNPVVLVHRVLFKSVFVLLATGLLIWRAHLGPAQPLQN